ncbi:hypothetical protein R1flu_015737 [Riccia fluitans]|uniref:Uncharacterized protein n=1 Tax=Riccia fluitans TaxID=41844 RepID=A0ABD1XN49_9MARC
MFMKEERFLCIHSWFPRNADVNKDGDETPDIQMTEMPLTEEARPGEAVNAPVEFTTTDVPVAKYNA